MIIRQQGVHRKVIFLIQTNSNFIIKQSSVCNSTVSSNDVIDDFVFLKLKTGPNNNSQGNASLSKGDQLEQLNENF